MVGFSPANTILGQSEENVNVNYTITYTDINGAQIPVIITPVESNDTINISNGVISGRYTNSFNDTIYYRNQDDTFDTVNKFSEVNMNNYSELIHYNVDTTPYKDYTYNVTLDVDQENAFSINSKYTLIDADNDEDPIEDLFGYSVASDGDYLLIGAPGEVSGSLIVNGVQTNSGGIVYVYSWSTGTLLRKLFNPNASTVSRMWQGDTFGWSVAISGNVAIVGAPHETDVIGTTYFDSGKAYIFDVTTGTRLRTINNPNAAGTRTNDLFGSAVAINGDYFIISATGETATGSSALDVGRVYLHKYSTNTMYSIINPNPQTDKTNNNFGQSIATDGNYLVIGAPGVKETESTGPFSGKAYIYDLQTRELLYELSNPNSYGVSDYDQFGGTVAIRGNYLAIAAYGSSDVNGNEYAGTVYLYDVVTGQLIRTINDPNIIDDAVDSISDDAFGCSITMNDHYIVIGANGESNVGDPLSGKVYVFDLLTGELLRYLINPTIYDVGTEDGFGSSVVINGNKIAVGTPWESQDYDTAWSSGVVYTYEINDLRGSVFNKTYTAVVQNNWSNAKNNLLSFLNKTAGTNNWRNDNYTVIKWKNDAGTIINWKTE